MSPKLTYVYRAAARRALWPAPSALRFDVVRGTLLSMVGQGFGIAIVGAATSLLPAAGIVFLPFADQPEPVAFPAIQCPQNHSATLQNLADKMNRSTRFS
ncbi:hypothetical protein [Phyllobacterium phragmitis]|uniref:hypothetical protein n=1 Tax=Phyllobacterium phragmitis TaxID=2670329 RepID=UPI0018EBFEF5|nr:hypothetical protein [Phyllobacterium phragmitis]